MQPNYSDGTVQQLPEDRGGGKDGSQPGMQASFKRDGGTTG